MTRALLLLGLFGLMKLERFIRRKTDELGLFLDWLEKRFDE